MSFASCSSCVVILNQQQEENVSHQKQCQDIPVQDTKNTGENCTVVENGRVVVKPSQAPKE
ncbi:MAG: hypothetical protein RMY62_014310 [Nostoc sp. ZfuVER08]|jgi:hypothetical protein|uniref:Uncharacterized protein n=1 Tax=Nostoc punctiforme FACHB-252 TaxID=1357509 RepID=A0ABR8H4X0_NOSPU|nr:hypothetical protein [Nostoc punctiforme]MBC1239264.1 hypothetical protein [Nostoc sp. 2RC]MBD2610447.1 hypothetical protein [Nostoc punctiforme FACHB-252]MBL1203348.1 hypothetical protein [Nostoc sp. GBBB01]MDZ8012836.1 hypothetical protein [Nostoc sp. ZfuVER08]